VGNPSSGYGVGSGGTSVGSDLTVTYDTEFIPEMKELKNIDVAFLCMNLPFTQTPIEAAEAVRAIRPRVVYPYHYRGQDTRTFAEGLKDEKSVEVRLRNWY
jgi:L-ascorbate metabolism protein UlaG (beta-lactamase superfamily)